MLVEGGEDWKEESVSKSEFSDFIIHKNAKEIRFRREEEYRFGTLPEKIMKDPKGVSYTMMENTREAAGTFGTARIEYLKEQFDNIIENGCPPAIKAMMYTFTKIPINKWLKMQK